MKTTYFFFNNIKYFLIVKLIFCVICFGELKTCSKNQSQINPKYLFLFFVFWNKKDKF